MRGLHVRAERERLTQKAKRIHDARELLHTRIQRLGEATPGEAALILAVDVLLSDLQERVQRELSEVQELDVS